ncbi:MAG: hypothetical protein KGL29_06250, partial [Alphaproteobacteria bacterium]|nr:hypothetical protein [Alphaproteobacteria bacterium]
MKTHALSRPQTPRILAVAQRRARRRQKSGTGVCPRENSANNYLAEKSANLCPRYETPNGGKNRKGAGAPRGNRNAVTHGGRTAEMKALKAEVRAALRRLKCSMAMVKAELALRRQKK